MDQADLRLFARLVSSPFLTDEELGREIELTGKAVRLRRQRLEQGGVLTDYSVHPVASVLGRHAVTRRYRTRKGLELPISRLQEIEDLVLVRRFRPDLCTVLLFTERHDASEDPRLGRLLGEPYPDPLEGPSSPAPPDRSRLSRTDWKVIEAIVHSPRTSLVSWSRRAKVSARTFRRRFAGLERAQVLEHSVILDLTRESGLATYGVWLKVDHDFEEKALPPIPLWDRPHWTQHPRGVYLLGSAENYFQAREIEIQLGALPGVLSAEPLSPAGGLFARDRVHGWVRDEMERV